MLTPKLKHRHDSSVTSLEDAHVNNSIIYIYIYVAMCEST